MGRPESIEETYRDACYRLRDWGAWAASSDGLGFPSMSIEQTAINGGIDSSSSGLFIDDNPEVAAIEAILLSLAKRNVNQYMAIKWYFMNPNFTIKKVAIRMYPLGATKVKNCLREGVAWVDGRLCD